MNGQQTNAAEQLLRAILPDEEWDDNEHLAETPLRFSQMLYDLTHAEPFEFTTFENTLELNEMIVERDIPFYSLCAHHILPFFGKAHIAYIPNHLIAGASKLARTVEFFMRGLWVQEHLTDIIATHLQENLMPQGIAVVMEGEHLCMTMRGARTPGAKMTTSVMQGVFLDTSKHARHEFLSLVQARGVS